MIIWPFSVEKNNDICSGKNEMKGRIQIWLNNLEYEKRFYPFVLRYLFVFVSMFLFTYIVCAAGATHLGVAEPTSLSAVVLGC